MVSALILLALSAVPGDAEAQCAMCRTAFDSPEGRAMASAYRRGVLFLLTVPFLAFGTIAYLAIRARRGLDDD